MKLKVNKEKCIGCGQCVSMTDQKVFDFDDDNLAKVVESPVSNENEEAATEAMENKDSFKLGVIRMVKGAMQLEKPNPREELTDDDVIKVICIFALVLELTLQLFDSGKEIVQLFICSCYCFIFKTELELTCSHTIILF